MKKTRENKSRKRRRRSQVPREVQQRLTTALAIVAIKKKRSELTDEEIEEYSRSWKEEN
ncbi:MAG TPA: hypothetical protein VF974_06270 [Patescibacteria group bacterium]